MVDAIPSISLATADGNLTLSSVPGAPGSWSQVHLVRGGASRLLGAEDLQYLIAHILSFLVSQDPGQQWVFSVSEPHGAAYGEHSVKGAVLRFQDVNARFLDEVVLTSDEKRQWIEELRSHRST
jgi:hypothetical protein